MDLSKLKTSDWVIGVSAIVLFVASFLDWFTLDVGIVGVGITGWDAGFLWGVLPVLIGLAMLAVTAIRAFAPTTKLPNLPWGQVMLIAGCVAAALVVLKLITGEAPATRAFGLFLATAAAIGLAVGGFLKFQDERAGAGSGTATPL